MGESATAMGRGRAVGPMPASRPTGRSGLGYPLALEWRNLRLNCQWHTTTTASHCKGQRRCQFPSRCGAVTGPWISGHTDACKASSESCWRGRATRPIFDHRETGSAVLARAGARSGRVAESDGATARAGCQTSIFRPPRSLHAYWRGRATRPSFDHRETGSAVLARAGARSGRVAESDGATAQAVAGPRDFGPLGRCMHIGEGARHDRFSTIDERGRRCLREPAHGLGDLPRAIARPGRLLPDLRVSAPSVVARILAWARDATDFRPSMNGVGGACASRRTV